MKKLKKIGLVILSVFLIICQLNSTTYAYTIDQVKGIIRFKVIETGNEPEYDIKIDAKDMIEDEKLPCIRTTIETVLYSDEGIFNVNFFNPKNSSANMDRRATPEEKSTKNNKMIIQKMMI